MTTPDLIARLRQFSEAARMFVSGKDAVTIDTPGSQMLAEAATALESLQARLDAAEKVCEAAVEWNEKRMSDKDFSAVVWAEWEKGR